MLRIDKVTPWLQGGHAMSTPLDGGALNEVIDRLLRSEVEDAEEEEEIKRIARKGKEKADDREDVKLPGRS